MFYAIDESKLLQGERTRQSIPPIGKGRMTPSIHYTTRPLGRRSLDRYGILDTSVISIKKENREFTDLEIKRSTGISELYSGITCTRNSNSNGMLFTALSEYRIRQENTYNAPWTINL